MGLIRNRKSGMLAAAAVALTVGAALPAATVDAQRGGGGYHGDRYDGHRGSLCIGRNTHEFYFSDSPKHGILGAFHACGYDAWISKGSIYVRYHGHRPRFTLRAPGYSFGVSYRRGCLVITPKCLAPPPKKTIRYRVRDTWGHDYHPPRRWHGHRGYHHGPRWGWNVNWSWGHKPHYPKHRGWHKPRRCR